MISALLVSVDSLQSQQKQLRSLIERCRSNRLFFIIVALCENQAIRYTNYVSQIGP